MKSKYISAICACAVGTALFISGCGGSDDEGSSGASLVGTWTWESATINGITVNMANPAASTAGGSTVITPASVAQLAATQGLTGVNITVTVTLNADGTVSGTLNATAPGETPEVLTVGGSYTTSGDTITLTLGYNGQSASGTGTYTVSSDSLTLNMSNAQILQILGANAGAMGSLSAEEQALLRGMSGSLSFSR